MKCGKNERPRLNKLENARKGERKELKQKEKRDIESKEQHKRNQKASSMKKDRDGVGFKGKMLMERSKKKSVKLRKIEEKIDPQIEDRKRYVGDA